jgi:hypothetical protein
LQPYHVAAANELLEIDTFVISAALPIDKYVPQTNTSCVPKFCYQSIYCVIWYLLVRIYIAKCFTNTKKRFLFEIMFENEHMFYS